MHVNLRSCRFILIATIALVYAPACGSPPATDAEAQQEHSSSAPDPLPSWNDGATKDAIVSFVERVTNDGGTDFVAPEERVAVFDNDGTLWSEQPAYFQLLFALDRVKELAPDHSEWKSTQPFKGVLEDDMKSALAGGEQALVQIIAATHAGMTMEEFDEAVSTWVSSARHPKTNRPYTEMVYQPMLEVLDYLRANGFKTFIVSGGGIDFMRPWVERVYGIPPEQVVGSRIKKKYEVRDGTPVIVRLPEIDFIDDKVGKPIGISNMIGRRPIAAFGNSDGDFEMLEWVTAGSGPRLGVIIHHTDSEREYAYDRKSHIGQLARGLDEGPKRGWTIVDMKQDWAAIYP
jgi:hypothetical protein